MEKKDIYEHLAKIYLDASLKKTTKAKSYPKYFKNVYLMSVASVFLVSLVIFIAVKNRSPFSSQTSLVLLSDSAKMNFHFDPVRKEAFSLALNKLNLNRFKDLVFAVKNVDHENPVSLRIEFANAFKEKSEYYVRDIPRKWKEFKVALSRFSGINDWSEMENLTFTVEEWNAKQKNGIVYIDNVRLLK